MKIYITLKAISLAYDIGFPRFFFCWTRENFTEILTYKTSQSEIVSRKDNFSNFGLEKYNSKSATPNGACLLLFLAVNLYSGLNGTGFGTWFGRMKKLAFLIGLNSCACHYFVTVHRNISIFILILCRMNIPDAMEVVSCPESSVCENSLFQLIVKNPEFNIQINKLFEYSGIKICESLHAVTTRKLIT